MSSISLFNEIAETFLDGRLDGIVGNTVSQSCFGNNIETTIGQGIEFNIDWMGYYFQGNTVPNVLTLLSLIRKQPALDMHSGFFGHTVGDQLDLHSNGKLWDLYRGLSTDKTEFAFDSSACPADEQSLYALEPFIDFVFWFNIFTCIATQSLTIFSSIISENDTSGESTENATIIINILELIIYLTVPIVNSVESKLITDVEIIFAGLKKDETEDAEQESKFKALEKKVETLEKQLATLSTQTTTNETSIAAIRLQIDSDETNRADQNSYQEYVNGPWNKLMLEYQIELATFNKQLEIYNQKEQKLKSNTTRQIGSWFGHKAFNPETYKPDPPPQKPIWDPPNIIKYPVPPA